MLGNLSDVKKNFHNYFVERLGFVPNVGFFPLQIATPFPVSTNGHFALFQFSNSLANLKIKWNKYLFEEVISQAWVKFIIKLQAYVDQKEAYYKFWPIVDQTQFVLLEFFSNILKNIIKKINQDDEIFEKMTGFPVINTPSEIIEALKKSDKHFLKYYSLRVIYPIFEKLGIIFINRIFENNIAPLRARFSAYITDMRDIASVLTSLNRNRACNLDMNEAELFIKYLSFYLRFSKTKYHIETIKCLPIFKEVGKNVTTSLNLKNVSWFLLQTDEKENYVASKEFRFLETTSEEACYLLKDIIKIQRLEQVEYWIDYVIKYLEFSHNKNLLIQKFFERLPRLVLSRQFDKDKVCNYSIVPCMTIQGKQAIDQIKHAKPIDLYDPFIPSIIHLFFDDEQIFPEEKFWNQHKESLKTLGVKASLSSIDIIERIKTYIKHKNNEFLSLIKSQKWIPTIDKLGNKSFSLLSECYDKNYEHLVSLILPILDYQIIESQFRKLLEWNIYPSVNTILEQMRLCSILPKENINFKNQQKICKAIYSYFYGALVREDEPAKRVVKKMSDGLKDKKWIFCESNFYATENIVFNLSTNLVNELPIIKLPEDYRNNFIDVFKHMGVRENIDISDFIKVIKKIAHDANNRALSDEKLSKTIAILEQIGKELNKSNNKRIDYLKDLYIPSIDAILFRHEEIKFDDRHGLSDDEKKNYNLSHPKLSLALARELRIRMFSEAFIEGCDIDFEVDKQSEFLTNCSLDSMFREFLQNADQAGARRISIYIDERQWPEQSTLLSKEMYNWQGPAIWIYYDAKIKEDFSLLDKSGIITSYYLTDVLTCVSGEEIVFLDSQAKFLPMLGNPPRQPQGIKLNFLNKKFLSRFEDQCKPYIAIENCNFQKCFNGTLFRLPFRSFELSKQRSILPISVGHKEILKYFCDLKDNQILFLRNIETYNIYYIPVDKNKPKELIWEEKIQDLEENVRKIRKKIDYIPQIFQLDTKIYNKQKKKTTFEAPAHGSVAAILAQSDNEPPKKPLDDGIDIFYNKIIPKTTKGFWPFGEVKQEHLYYDYALNVLQNIGKSKVFWTEAEEGKFVSLDDAYFSEENDHTIANILAKHNISTVKVEKAILYQLKNLSEKFATKYQTINPAFVYKSLRENSNILKNVLANSHNNILTLLKFVLHDENLYSQLIGLPLIPLKDGSFGKFKEQTYYYIAKKKDQDLFPKSGPSRFICDLDDELSKIFKSKDFLRIITNIKKLDTQGILDLLAGELCKEQEISWNPSSQDIPNRQWLDDILEKMEWGIGLEFAELSEYPLLPVVSPSNKLVRADSLNPLITYPVNPDEILMSALGKLGICFTDIKLDFKNASSEFLKKSVFSWSDSNVFESINRKKASQKISMESLFSKAALGEDELNKLREFVKDSDFSQQGNIEIIQELPIWPTRSEEYISAKEGMLLPRNLPCYSLDKDLFDVPDEYFRILTLLGAKQYKEFDYIKQYYYTPDSRRAPKQEDIEFLEKILLLNDPEIMDYLKSFKSIPNRSLKSFVKADTLYNANEDLLFNRIFDDNRFLPSQLQNNHDCFRALLKMGLKQDLNNNTYIECAREIEFKINIEDELKQLYKIKFVPSNKNLPNPYSETVGQAGRTSGYESFGSLYSIEYLNICWTQAKFFASDVKHFEQLPNIGMVIDHWDYLFERKIFQMSDWEIRIIYKIMEEIYQFVSSEFLKKEEDKTTKLELKNLHFLNGDDPFNLNCWVSGNKLAFGIQDDIGSDLFKEEDPDPQYHDIIFEIGNIKIGANRYVLSYVAKDFDWDFSTKSNNN
ncbi:Sacsin [Gigaspora margarita]|uniref:Sacsin n=1 Tax=Gigaspora margarita TaxID=4874 RepID=A0A8H3XBT1_GIGMA|nr:Sacsin [Gigaspora margarita]